MRADDAFWGARIVARFTDEAIGAVVRKAQYSDPRATDYMTATLIMRRDKVLRTWLNVVNPVTDPVLSPDGRLTFANAATAARVADAPESYTLQWFRFDNIARRQEPVGDASTVSTAAADAPAALLSGDAGAYIGVTITARHTMHTAWAKPATFYFRRSPSGWTWVGAERE
jgi:hypothetical protein